MRSIFLPIIIAISLLVGCNKSAPKAVEALDRAEAVMEEHPDSAFKILSAIDTATLCSDADRALYALPSERDGRRWRCALPQRIKRVDTQYDNG